MFVRVSVVPLGESLYDGAISNMNAFTKSAIPRGGVGGVEAMHSISKLSGTPYLLTLVPLAGVQ